MVGHYILGFVFAGLFVYSYSMNQLQRKAFVWAMAFYFLACLSKEVFVPLIALPLLDPRDSIPIRLRRLLLLVMVFLGYWIVRAVMIQQAVGGYNDLGNL